MLAVLRVPSRSLKGLLNGRMTILNLRPHHLSLCRPPRPTIVSIEQLQTLSAQARVTDAATSSPYLKFPDHQQSMH